MFYERHFGFRWVFDAAGGHFLRNDASFLLALTPANAADERVPPTLHLGFHLASPEEVVHMMEMLRQSGVRTTDLEDARPNENYVSFRCWDPDGTELELLWDTT